ncbi:MAG: pyridoxamine 5'-phosphate oxidase family protein [Archangiaceae bacterium]|nr:pyridoxamine 5'-phosphate oxidase family protein [Archangiaceae bacterium]
MATRKKLTGKEHVMSVLKSFDTLMVGTYQETGSSPSLHLRPMAVAKLEDDGSICFLTSIATPKVDEALSPRRGQICGQAKRRHVWADGSFELSDDRERIRSMWSAGFDVWFDGPDDPQIVLMVFHPHDVEVWDNTGAKGIKFAFDAAKALITGEKPQRDDNPEQHERVPMH